MLFSNHQIYKEEFKLSILKKKKYTLFTENTSTAKKQNLYLLKSEKQSLDGIGYSMSEYSVVKGSVKAIFSWIDIAMSCIENCYLFYHLGK